MEIEQTQKPSEELLTIVISLGNPRIPDQGCVFDANQCQNGCTNGAYGTNCTKPHLSTALTKVFATRK